MQCRFYTSQSLLKHSRAVMRYSKGHPRCCLPLVSMSATSCVPHSSCSSISIVHQGVVILNQILPVIVHVIFSSKRPPWLSSHLHYISTRLHHIRLRWPKGCHSLRICCCPRVL